MESENEPVFFGMRKDAVIVSLYILLGGPSALIVLCFVMAGIAMIDMQWDSISYFWFEVPQIKAEISQIEGVTFVEATNLAPPDEEVQARITLEIVGKGELNLWNPTAQAINNQELIHIFSIDGCRHRYGSPFPTYTLTEIIENYDQVYIDLQTQGRCY